MSDNNTEYKASTFVQLMLVIPGAILALTLIIALIAKSASPAATPAPAPVVADTSAAVLENIKPVAIVVVAAADAGPHVDKTGEEVVKAVCSMCHAAGLMNAPKIGDKDAWKPRIAQGQATLISHATNGIRSMPAKGGNSSLSDNEVSNAVVYMANAGGAAFK